MGKLLKQGSKGTDVKKLQKALNKSVKPSPKLKEDGMFGGGTLAAVKAFQKKNKLKVDGLVGPNTMTAIEKGGSKGGAGAAKGAAKGADKGSAKGGSGADKGKSGKKNVDALRGKTKLLKDLKTQVSNANKKVAELEVMLNQLDKMLKSTSDDYALGDAGLGSWSKKQRFAKVAAKMAMKKLQDSASKTISMVE